MSVHVIFKTQKRKYRSEEPIKRKKTNTKYNSFNRFNVMPFTITETMTIDNLIRNEHLTLDHPTRYFLKRFWRSLNRFWHV